MHQKIISALIALAMGLNAFGFHSAFHLSSDATLHTCAAHDDCHSTDSEHQHHSHNDGTEHEHEGGDQHHHHDCSLCHHAPVFAEQYRLYQLYPPIIPDYLPAWDKRSPEKPILEQDVPPIIA